jgi:hypothetical protein
MSLTELYSAMVAREADRLAEDRRRRQSERGPVRGSATQTVVAQESQRSRALELENAEIKAGFSAFVNLLMSKGIIQRSDLEGLLKMPAALPPPTPAASGPVSVTTARPPNSQHGKKRKGRRR